MKKIIKNILFLGLVISANLNALHRGKVAPAKDDGKDMALRSISAVVPRSPSVAAGTDLKSGAISSAGLWSEDQNTDTAKFYEACDKEDVKQIHQLVSKINSTITIATIVAAKTKYHTKSDLVAQLNIAHQFLTSEDKAVLMAFFQTDQALAKSYIEHRLIDAAINGKDVIVKMLLEVFKFDDEIILVALRVVEDHKNAPRRVRRLRVVDEAFDRVVSALRPFYDGIQSTHRMELEDIQALASYNAAMAKAEKQRLIYEALKETGLIDSTPSVGSMAKTTGEEVCCATCCGTPCCSCWLGLCSFFSCLRC